MDLLILYATQTGNAEVVAYDLSRECYRRNIPIRLLQIDHYPISNLPNDKLIVFITSTTGLGEPPDSLISFYNFLLTPDLPSNLFENINYTVFGLGDSSYEDFNAIARVLSIRLKQLGANEFYRRGLGDDMHDFYYEAEYHPWCEGL